MKKIITTTLCLVFVMFLVGCSATPDKRVMRYYDKHIAELKDNIESHFADGTPLSFPSIGVTVNKWDGEHIIIEYVVKGVGSSQYVGFFYSKDDVPVSFQNVGEEMNEISDTEWEWHGEGDNHGYVCKIEPYWFYFEASL